MQTLSQCPYSLRVQSHASTSVRVLKKNPNTGSHSIVWTQENIAYPDRNGYSAALAPAVSFPGVGARISSEG